MIQQMIRAGVVAGAAVVLTAAVASANVDRIREMALEMEQKLNRARFEMEVKGAKPNMARVYKDYDFILRKSKVSDVAKTDAPYKDRLRLYLVESIVEMELAEFTDHLKDFELNHGTREDETAVPYTDLLQNLAKSGDAGDRRKLYNDLADLVETGAVFRYEILSRRNENYTAWGFDNYAGFFAEREQMDLATVKADATTFLAETKPLYDRLFETMAQKYLGTEARKVKFYDLPYLANGPHFVDLFPEAEAQQRAMNIFKGFGLDLRANKGLEIDAKARTGKVTGAHTYPMLVPTSVGVSVFPMGSAGDDPNLVYGLGEAQVFLQSTATQFEPAYLPSQLTTSAMAWIPRFVLDDPHWIRANAQGDAARIDEYLEFRAFASLYEARKLAGLTQFEIAIYNDAPEPDKIFREIMNDALDVRISSSDAKRSLEFVTQLRSAARFEGFLLATNARQTLRERLGEEWHQTAGAELKKLWARGGALTPADVSAAFTNAEGATATFLADLEAMIAVE